jgi:hypothetical protein
MSTYPRLLNAVGLLLAAILFAPASAFAACAVSASVTTTLGTYSPSAVNAGAVPALQTRAGLVCPSAVLTLLSNNAIKAKFTSQNAFALLRQGGGGSVAYTASADLAGTVPFAQGQSVDYMQNNLLNLLGLLGGNSADLPFFVKPGGSRPPVGAYSDTITIDWDWNLCPGIGALGLCIGVLDKNTGQSTVVVTLIVSPQDVIVTLSTRTTSDPVDGVSNPKAVPGSKQRVTMVVTNPDIVPLEAGSLNISLPTPAGMVLALDGDGATSGDAIRLADGAPASGVTLRYGGGSDGSDDVDFSADGGTQWSYAPIALQDGVITHIRIRPQRAMTAGSTFSVSVPYAMK